jgi:hypothetical protein
MIIVPCFDSMTYRIWLQKTCRKFVQQKRLVTFFIVLKIIGRIIRHFLLKIFDFYKKTIFIQNIIDRNKNTNVFTFLNRQTTLID